MPACLYPLSENTHAPILMLLQLKSRVTVPIQFAQASACRGPFYYYYKLILTQSCTIFLFFAHIYFWHERSLYTEIVPCYSVLRTGDESTCILDDVQYLHPQSVHL
jgi:hypothetical protein